MIKVIVTSNTRGARITQGDARYVAIMVEENIRALNAESTLTDYNDHQRMDQRQLYAPKKLDSR